MLFCSVEKVRQEAKIIFLLVLVFWPLGGLCCNAEQCLSVLIQIQVSQLEGEPMNDGEFEQTSGHRLPMRSIHSNTQPRLELGRKPSLVKFFVRDDKEHLLVCDDRKINNRQSSPSRL
ncbi:hypothetical protein OUZ56_013714 [Daphnia magna]|uniref:Uncharacterized protein n=1 Tax=Daphnia magna TaxID=35525 RepID=A0ABQ9Z6R0_9CRUS|nr:hypothetical protein OUZ56_013714 [Daphnia magna]